MNTETMFSSEKDYWETPQSLFNALDSEFHFTLDVAASDQNAKCKQYYTKESDGLQKDWGGRQFSVILHMAQKRLDFGRKSVIMKV